jgi:hypothetical protein
MPFPPNRSGKRDRVAAMNLPRAIAVALLLGAAALLAGCGDDDETTVTVQETIEETSEDPATEGPNHFQSPSGNIGCYLDAKHARCDIRKRDWKPTPSPQPCELDYGQGIVLDATHAEFVCAGDTALGGPKTLGYGETAQRGPFVCDSEEDGITCSHTGNGHGFFLSREKFRLF